eukprot:294875-Rhodomonas_salina.1
MQHRWFKLACNIGGIRRLDLGRHGYGRNGLHVCPPASLSRLTVHSPPIVHPWNRRRALGTICPLDPYQSCHKSSPPPEPHPPHSWLPHAHRLAFGRSKPFPAAIHADFCTSRT